MADVVNMTRGVVTDMQGGADYGSPMPTQIEEFSRDAVARRLREARSGKFGSAAEAARAMGMKDVTVRAHETGQNGVGAGNAKRYARAYGVTPEWLLYGNHPVGTSPNLEDRMTRFVFRDHVDSLSERPRRVPVVGQVNAGVFKEQREFSPDDATSYLTIAVNGYEAAHCYALEVAGPSMNKVYPEGRLVIVAPVAEVGLREGDYAVIRRSVSGLFETTIKEVVPIEGGVALWPRSTHPDFQQPLIIPGDEMNQDAPEVIGVVIADYQKRDRSGLPIAFAGLPAMTDFVA